MSKVRVYEVARELGMNNRELLHRIHSLGIQVRNHMSALDPAEVDRVKRAVEKDKSDNTVEERVSKTVIRRRTKKKKKPKAAAKPAPAAPTNGSSNGGPANGAAAPVRRRAAAAKAEPAPRPEPAPEPPVEREATPPPAAAPEQVEAAPAEAAPAPPEPTPEAVPTPAPEPTPPPVAEAVAEAAPEPTAEPTAEPTPEPAPAEAAPLPEPAPAPAVPPPPAPSLDEPPKRVEPTPPPLRPRRLGPRSVEERLGHDNLPPGVVVRGNASAPAAQRISEEQRRRIVAEHQRQQSRAPRRRSVDRASIGPAGRPGSKRPRPSRNKKAGLKTEITIPSAQKRIIKIEDNITLQTLAQRMSLKATQVLMKLVTMGMTDITINSTLDYDTAQIIASEFNYEVENVAKSDDELVAEARGDFIDEEEKRETRPPIVTVMGHVDHGKTSLLDKIRSKNVAGREAGGITQHIGAYRVSTKKAGDIVFLDTPGHQAFTAMRARGAQATDVVVLVVAADDGVMPQTVEAINHAKAAEVPIIVAVNKIDKEGARPDNIRQELSGKGLQPEEWGGDTLFVDVSAITGQGIDELLESISLQSEILELTANPEVPGAGVVLEAYLDKGRGPVANVLIRNGTMHQGDYVLAGAAMGKVRALTDENGQRLKEAGPATPVEILGLSDVSGVGEQVYVVADEAAAKEIAEQRRLSAEAKAKAARRLTMADVQDKLRRGDVRELNLIIKSDVQGSNEALTKALLELSTEKVEVKVIHTGVGGITENDVMLASASSAIIIGFNVRPAGKAGATAKNEGIDIRTYRVIYDAVDDVRKAMTGLLEPEYQAEDVGKAEVRATFGIPKIGTIAGCYVTDGKILRNGKARLVRDSTLIWEGDIASLRRFKDDVREVAMGYECGIGLANFSDIKEGDIIECYQMVEIEVTL